MRKSQVQAGKALKLCCKLKTKKRKETCIMSIKSKNKRVGLCLITIAACVILVASPVAADTCPIVDGDVIPFGDPPVDPPDFPGGLLD